MTTTQALHDEYLETKLRVVLESLVEALLTEKPEDSQEFCMEWLARWYIDSAPESAELSKLRAERDLLQERRNELHETAESLGLFDDERAEQAKIAQMKSSDRRAGVSAPAISEDRMKDWKTPFFQKPQEARLNIKQIIQHNDKLNVLFGHLTEGAVFEVIDAMKPVSVELGSDLIVQGDEGDNFYIVDEGTFDIFVKRGDALPGKVMECGPGAMFGELALMYNAPRAATVTATSPAKVWALDRESFQMLLATAENTKKSKYEEFLSNIELFKHMTRYELAQLSDLLESELYDDEEDIMKQGDEGGAFYILEDGQAKAYISGDKGEVEVKHYTDPGEFFGEVALITNAPRRATVRAVGGGCTVLAVTTEDFDKVLGSIRDVLAKNIDRYPRYADVLRESAK